MRGTAFYNVMNALSDYKNNGFSQYQGFYIKPSICNFTYYSRCNDVREYFAGFRFS